MRETVVDASALAALAFDEPEAEPIAASIAGRTIAPTLLRYELASVCTTKLVRHPGHRASTLARYALALQADLAWFEPDWATLPELAQRWALSAYDAAYLQLALARGAALVTLDARLAAAFDHATA